MLLTRAFHLIPQLFLLLIFLIFIAGCGGNDELRFYDSKNIQINYNQETESWWLSFSSDRPVLCAVNLGEANDGGFTQLQAMNMTSPSIEHKLELTLNTNTRYRAIITTFDTAHNVQRSQVFHFETMATQDKTANLIEESSTQFNSISNIASANNVWSTPPSNSGITSNSANIQFETNIATLASTAYGNTENFGYSARISGGVATRAHNLQLLALSSDTTYYYNHILIDEAGHLYQSENFTLTTEKGIIPDETLEKNVALLSLGASISNVSSNYGNNSNESSFGANKAIDGDPGTQWSSNGDGDNATIEITLDRPYLITKVGFWTRTMSDGSAQITQFEVLYGDALGIDDTSLGIFDIPDATQLYKFDIPYIPPQQTLKFKVINSSGGNTGARTIAIYSESDLGF